MTKTCAFGKMPREEAPVLKGFCKPRQSDTTSEPHGRKCHAGYARYRVNEWLCLSRSNQGGTVEY